MTEKTKIFISYSHKDDEWLKRLKTFLNPFVRESELKVWSDTDIQPSLLWESEIKKAINDATAAILLVSQDFLASDFISNNELPPLLNAARERGLRIFPIIVSSCYLKNSPILRFQSVNSIESPLDTLEKPAQNAIFSRLAGSIDDLLKLDIEGITEEWLEKFRERFELVAGGRYVMGDNVIHNKMHALIEQEVEVESFNLGRYVITQSEWAAITNTQPWAEQRNVREGDNIPAVYINWYDAFDFLSMINRVDSKWVRLF